MMCKVLGVSKSGYYSWLEREPSRRDIENQTLMVQIRNIHIKSKKTYGSPRIMNELKDNLVNVSRPRVARLMRKAGIRAVGRKIIEFNVASSIAPTAVISYKTSKCLYHLSPGNQVLTITKTKF